MTYRSAVPGAIYSNGAKPSLTFAPLEAVLANVPSEPEWVWKGYLAPGCLTLLAGRPKAGKSTLVFALFSALRDGKTLLGQPTRAAKVVMLTEEGQHTLAEKARQMRVCGSGHVQVLLRHQAYGRDWSDVVREAVCHANQVEAHLLVVDTFAEWAALAGDDENVAGSVLEALRPLREATASGLAVLLIAHQRKSSGQHGTAVRGSSALTGSVDIILELERHRDISLSSESRVLRAQSRFSSTPAEIKTKFGDSEYAVFENSVLTKAAEEAERLLAILGEHGEGLVIRLAQSLGRPSSTVRKRLEALRRAGKVERSGKGVKGNPFVYRPVAILSTRKDIYRAETNSGDDQAACLPSGCLPSRGAGAVFNAIPPTNGPVNCEAPTPNGDGDAANLHGRVAEQ